MRSLWQDKDAQKFFRDPLALRVYTSRLIGKEPTLVLHGGGNTSVKTQFTNLFGDQEEVLYIKGSGWDLATIKKEGFAPVKMDVLLKMARLPKLTDSAMVNNQRAAMVDPNAPTPSVEAILHAIIPLKFVDHTHADSVVTVTNSPGGEKRIRDIYGKKVIVIPYVMPGFILARKVYEMTKDIHWRDYEGMILMHHGIFTFHDEAKSSYERMIRLVSMAENYLKTKKAYSVYPKTKTKEDLVGLASLRRAVSKVKDSAMLAKINQSHEAVYFSTLKNVASAATRGPLTPDHVIRTKRVPVVLKKNMDQDVQHFAVEYQKYFKRNTDGKLTMLDSAPRWAVWPKQGIVNFGKGIADTKIVFDITCQTIQAIMAAEKLGGWKALKEKDIFDIEYWELEQAKLKKAAKPPLLTGKVALVTGAASGIGKACVEALYAQGAVVGALDIDKKVMHLFHQPGILPIVCDLTQEEQIEKAVGQIVREFGGIDIVISNAGVFPASEKLEEMRPETWQKSLSVNLTSHQSLLKKVIPYLRLGIDPCVIIVASKNVPAPGPGAGAYSVAKAGLTQLARVAALELAEEGIRVNVIHPNQVFDTAIWTKDVLGKRAKHYHMSVEEYKKSNLLKTEITSKDVAQLVCNLAGPAFLKTTGAQIPIDGGNDRVI